MFRTDFGIPHLESNLKKMNEGSKERGKVIPCKESERENQSDEKISIIYFTASSSH